MNSYHSLFSRGSRNESQQRWLRLAVWITLMAFLTALKPVLYAGGPLDPDGLGGFFRWNPANEVSLVFDNGLLKDTINVKISGQDGRTKIVEWAGLWEAVPTATIGFEDRGFLPGGVDVDETNFNFYLSGPNSAGNVVVFDADGKITEEIFGQGSSSVTLGFATADVINFNDNFYDYGFAVLNGLRADLNPSSFNTFPTTVIHELGHLLGLDHSQQSGERPVMYPYVSGESVPHLRVDDIAWISKLYPAPGFESLGSIQGQVRHRIGGPLQGANVVAIPANLTADKNKVSAVSDLLYTFEGMFELPGLAPGDYYVYIEPLNDAFTEGSGVGPHEVRFTDFPRDYYNGSQETGDESDPPLEKVMVSVAQGQIVTGIDMVSNESANQLDNLTDDDFEVFVFPDGFRFPFFGKVYDQVSVNSDGNLTFGENDWSSYPRDEERFLSGPARIAPLFTDLNPEIGLVTSEFDGERLTIRWNAVPEFDRKDGLRNTFEVSLYRNGDIRIHYDQVAVTPDDGLQAIVGLSPGGVSSADPVDLSTDPQQQYSVGPVFEVFENLSFDLTGATLFFEAQSSQYFLYFPYFEGDEVNFTGYGVTNDGPEEMVLEFEARASDGSLQDYPSNPHIETLASGRQVAKVGFDIFGLSLNEPRAGWVRIGSNHPELASFFQIGNGLDTGGLVTRMDGSVAFTEQSKILYFTRILDGPDVLLTPVGGQPVDAETWFYLANPNNESLRLEFRFYSPSGQEVASRVQRTLPPLGSMRESLHSIFGALPSAADGFVRAEVLQGTGAVGFELIVLEDTILGFNASFGNATSDAYSAQLAHGDSGGTRIFTSLKLVNTSSSTRTVELTPLSEQGQVMGAVRQINLLPNATFQQDVGTLFNLGSPYIPAVAGSIRVKTQDGGTGIVGDVIFGDPDTLEFAAALPLQTRVFTRAIFSQVANRLDPNPARSTFTGLAFFNPGAKTADLTVKVYTSNGELKGTHTRKLAAGNRFSELLPDLVPQSQGQGGGFIVLESTQPLVAQLLFGNPTLDFLSAVPPTIIQ